MARAEVKTRVASSLGKFGQSRYVDMPNCFESETRSGRARDPCLAISPIGGTAHGAQHDGESGVEILCFGDGQADALQQVQANLGLDLLGDVLDRSYRPN